jgi:hypothetical protein
MLLIPDRGNSSPQLAFAIDGELSVDHEAAFSTGGQLERLGVERALRSRRRGPPAMGGPRELRDQVDVAAELVARERIARAEGASDGGPSDGAAEHELREARQELGGLSPRTVLPHEHQRLLEAAIDSARSRLLISGGALSAAHFDRRMLGKLRGALRRKVMIRIAVREGPRSARSAQKSLVALAEDQPLLELGPEPPEGAESVLLTDNRFAVLGRYPWFGLLGDAERLLGDRRSLLTTDAARIDLLWRSLDGRSPQ